MAFSNCPHCGAPLAEEPPTVAMLRDWCTERGYTVSADLAVNATVTASILEVSELTLRNWRSLNIGPPHYRRGSVRYRLADLAAYLDAGRTG